MKVYGFPLSPFVRKVLVVAQEKGVETQIVPTNPMAPDDEFIAASPYRKIPAIDDDGFRLADSTAIAVYLEAKHPSPPLLPSDPQARARATWFDEVADTIVMAAGGPMLFNRFVKPKVMGQDCDEVAAQASIDALEARLGYLENAAGDGWLDGDFSLGDIALASVFQSLSYGGWQLDTAQYPKLAAWLGRVRSRPAWQAVTQKERAIFQAAGL